MTLSNVFDISPQNPLDEYSWGGLNGYVNQQYVYPAANQYAALNNKTNLAGLDQDKFGHRNYYYGSSAIGEHKGINWKQVLIGAAALTGTVCTLKFGAAKLFSIFKNPGLSKLERQIKSIEKKIVKAENKLKINDKIKVLQETYNNLTTKLKNLKGKQ